MLPTLVLHAAQPGILYINGQFAGEAGPERPLFRPIAPQGAVYLEFRPLGGGDWGIARRLVFSGGTPLRDSAEAAEELRIILWPGGTVEIEFVPAPRPIAPQSFRSAERIFTLDGRKLFCEGRELCTLPEGAMPPRSLTQAPCTAFLGQCDAGSYLLTLDAECIHHTGLLSARQIDAESDGRVRAICGGDDLVGHATLEQWRMQPEGLMRIGAESLWIHGAPRWPTTPEETARAAVEAMLSGLDAEAEGYLSPALRSRAPLTGLREKCDLCVEMKYAPPEARPCVGLLQLDGGNLGRVRPLYFHAAPGGGTQGPYQIDALEFGG